MHASIGWRGSGIDGPRQAPGPQPRRRLSHNRRLPREIAMTPFLLLLIPALACLLFALILMAGIRAALRRRKLGGALLRLLLGTSFLTSGLALLLLAGALYHFAELGREQRVASIALRQLEPQRWSARLETADGQHRSFELRGDEWQLDARVIRWKLPALLAGAPTLYRLERLSGRYGDVKQELEAQRTAYALADDAFPDLWTLRRQYPRYLPFVDADYGSAAYLPMLDGARYDVALGPRGGLVARPADDQTRKLLEQAGW
jgi:hypothetical protein